MRARVAREDQQAPRAEPHAHRLEIRRYRPPSPCPSGEGHRRVRAQAEDADRRPAPGVVGVRPDLAARLVEQQVERLRDQGLALLARQPEVLDPAREVPKRPVRNRPSSAGGDGPVSRDELVRVREPRAAPIQPARGCSSRIGKPPRFPGPKAHVDQKASEAIELVPGPQERLDAR